MTPLPNHIRDAIRHYIPALEGWVTPERGIEMAEMIYEKRPETVVELGVFGGRSLISQAMALRELNYGGVIYGIDPWKLESALEGENEQNREWWSKKIDIEAIHRGTMNALWQHNLDPWAVIIRAASQHAYKLFARIDMLFIDGNHSEVASTRDVELYVPKVSPGSYVIMDDCDWPTTNRALHLLDEMCALQRETKTDKGTYRVYTKR